MEGGDLFLPSRERLKTLYPKDYARGTTSTSEGAENWDIHVKLSARTHPGAAGSDSSLGGGNPSLARPTSLVGAPIDLLTVTWKTWLDRGSAYGGQKNSDLSTLVEVENFIEVGEVVGGVGSTENPPP